jgi:hypothetical protein
MDDFSMPQYTERTGGSPSPCCRCRHWPQALNLLGNLWLTKQVSSKCHTVSLSHPWDKPAQPPLDRLIPLQKKKTKLNKQQNWKLAQSRAGRGCWKHRRRGEGKGAELVGTISKQMAGGRTVGGDMLLPEVGKERRRQTTGLRPWTPPVRWLCSIEEQTAHNMLPGQPADGSLNLPFPRERGQGKNTSP